MRIFFHSQPGLKIGIELLYCTSILRMLSCEYVFTCVLHYIFSPTDYRVPKLHIIFYFLYLVFFIILLTIILTHPVTLSTFPVEGNRRTRRTKPTTFGRVLTNSSHVRSRCSILDSNAQ